MGAISGEDMREGELAHLGGGGLDKLLVAVAERGAPQARHALDIGLAVDIINVDPLGLFQHQRPDRAVGIEVRVGVDQRLDITRLEIGEHGNCPPASSGFADRSRLCDTGAADR
jgi:hypothetical protein